MITISAEGWGALEALCVGLNIGLTEQMTALSLGMAIGLYYPEYATAFCSMPRVDTEEDRATAEEFMQNVPLEGILTS